MLIASRWFVFVVVAATLVACDRDRQSLLVTGTVIDQDGAALAGAVVSIRPHLGEKAITSPVASDGTFRVPSTTDGAVADVRAPGRATRRIELRTAGELGRITLPPVRTVDAIVVDESGAPVANAHGQVAAAAPTGEGGFDIAEATTDPAGRLSVIAPESGATLTIVASGFEELEVELADGDAGELRLRLFRASTVVGAVVRDGRPVASAWVAVGTRRVQSRFDGSFTLPGAADRSRIEALHGDEIAMSTLDARAPIELDLTPGARLAGRITDRHTRRALGGVWIRLVRLTSSKGGTVGIRESGGLVADEVVTHADGTFALRPLRSGSAFLVVARPGYAARRVPVKLAAGHTSLVRVELEPLLDVAGRVVDTDGKPVAGARVEAVPADTGMPPEPIAATTTASGQFSLALRPDVSTLVVVRTAELRGEVTIPAGDARDATIVVLPAAHRRGRVVDEAGVPIEGARITVQAHGDERPDEPIAHSQVSGDFELRGLLPGTYAVEIARRGYATATVEVALGVGGGELEAIVLGPSVPLRGVAMRLGRPASRVVVFAQSRGRQTSAVTGADGTFVLEGFAADDTVALVAVTDGARSARTEVRAGMPVTLTLDPTRSPTGS